MKDGPCYYCGTQTESFAGNPGKWPVYLCHSDDPGKSKPHHVECVSIRLSMVKKVMAEIEAYVNEKQCSRDDCLACDHWKICRLAASVEGGFDAMAQILFGDNDEG
jgi:hypothetical protein